MDVQTLAVQKGELDSQMSERKSRLAQCKTDQQEEEENLQDLRSAVNKHKAGVLNKKTILQRIAVILQSDCDWIISSKF